MRVYAIQQITSRLIIERLGQSNSHIVDCSGSFIQVFVYPQNAHRSVNQSVDQSVSIFVISHSCIPYVGIHASRCIRLCSKCVQVYVCVLMAVRCTAVVLVVRYVSSLLSCFCTGKSYIFYDL